MESEPATTNAPSAVTIGTYDGVHRGHRALIDAVKEEAKALGVRSVVVTFDRHPASVIRPKSAPLLLCDLEHRVELLKATGVDEVVVLTFDEARAAQDAEEFVESVLVGDLGAHAVVVGTNFRFGHGQRGDLSVLEECGRRLGFTVVGMPLLIDDEHGGVVSSSRIRSAIAVGSMEDAYRMLGREYEMRGVIEHRDGICYVLAGATVACPPDGDYEAAVGPVGQAGHPAVVRVLHPFDEPGLVLIEVLVLEGPSWPVFHDGARASVHFVAAIGP